jgi:hypothetical protein
MNDSETHRAELKKLRWLQNVWREGLDSGDAGEID